MELHLILSVVSLVRWVLRYLDRLFWGSSATVLGFENLLPDPLRALEANPITLYPLRRVFGFLVAWPLWMLLLLLLSGIAWVGIVGAVEAFGGGAQQPWIELMVCVFWLLAVLVGAWYLAARMLRGIRVEIDAVGVLFYKGKRAVRVPWLVWLNSGAPRRKAWSSSVVVVSIADPELVALVGTSQTGIEVASAPCAVEVMDGSYHLVLHDGCEVPAIDLVRAFQAIARFEITKS